MSSERGASLVEMALVMPVLLLLVVGVIDLGRALWTDLALKDAAQDWKGTPPSIPDPVIHNIRS